MPEFLTLGTVAAHFGVPSWRMLATIKRGFLAEPKRMSTYRVFSPSDLPAIKEALIAAGYLRREEQAGAK